MKNIKLYRVLSNILFYIFYVLLLSIAFTFIFPVLRIALWYNIWLSNDVRFDIIQIVIIILVLIFTLIYRKFFYLPIIIESTINKSKNKYSYTKTIKEKKTHKEIKTEVKENNWPELDIKIGKEIK